MKKVNKKLSLNKNVISQLNTVKGGNAPTLGTVASLAAPNLCVTNDCNSKYCTNSVNYTQCPGCGA